MIIKRIPAGIYAANCYIVVDEATNETAVIDPGGNSDYILEQVDKLKGRIKFILLTHGHFDHIGAVAKISRKCNIPVYINKNDYTYISEDNEIFHLDDFSEDIFSFIDDASNLSLGDNKITIIETPGHSPGGLCFLIEDKLFSGDTLFLGSIGRTDFIGGDYVTLTNSIKNKLFTLSENVTVYPGHENETTIKREKMLNPYLNIE
jgi:Zn-dependent hydrolases, including glyoxylases